MGLQQQRVAGGAAASSLVVDAPAAPAGRPHTIDPDGAHRLRAHLEVIYAPELVDETLERLLALLDSFSDGFRPRRADSGPYDETDVLLITYGDQVTEPGRPPLQSLREFLVSHVDGAINGVHLLPLYPATSDDGFAVSDYLSVDPDLGQWSDVVWLGESFRLMIDAVFNHVSASNSWFARWRVGDPGFAGFFIEVDPDADVSRVTRPRASSLLTPVETIGGRKSVWTTFSADQVDLNYANPRVLLAMTEVLLTYVEYGAGIIRLDAIAYLWKRLGTPSVHLVETHEIVRLWRTVLDTVAPGTLLITETNVPHAENMRYFGNGNDEAHLVYQFPLAPLVLSAFHTANARTLQHWGATLRTPSPGTSFVNFLASHDGIGVRPAEGLLHPRDIDQLVERTKEHGGRVSYKANRDGSLSPYELNTTYYDALNNPSSDEPRWLQVNRFVAAYSILLALAGVPAIYIQALLGGRNWHDGVRHTGRARTINRRKYERADLEAELDDPTSLRCAVFGALRARIRLRTWERAFHPNGDQRILSVHPALFSFEREAPDHSSKVLCVHNVSARERLFVAGPQDGLTVRGSLTDLVTGMRCAVTSDGHLALPIPPYGVRWLRQVSV